MTDSPTDNDRLDRIARELKDIRVMMTKVIFYMTEAEAEVSEKMRRFIMYFHDIHDIRNLYHEGGQEAPDWVRMELQRCDDRFRQLVREAHTDGGVFEKVRREMAADEENRWDHTRQLHAPPKKEPSQ
jgi:hypothetical protein